jgi:hypothetical protein
VLGTVLALGMNRGRIVLAGDTLKNFAHGPHCERAGGAGWGCLFAPITNCTPADGDDVEDVRNEHRNAVPAAFQPLLDALGYDFDAGLYWWRIQSTTFLARLSPATAAELAARRLRLAARAALPGARGGVGRLDGAASVFVRHGDKVGETGETYDFPAYLARLEAYHGATRTLGLAHFTPRRIFLNSDDPDVISQALGMTRGHGRAANWTVAYVPARREKGQNLWADAASGAETFLNAWLNVLIALECDVYACTFFSNMCRLIDELRRTVGARNAAPYLEVGDGAFVYNW